MHLAQTCIQRHYKGISKHKGKKNTELKRSSSGPYQVWPVSVFSGQFEEGTSELSWHTEPDSASLVYLLDTSPAILAKKAHKTKLLQNGYIILDTLLENVFHVFLIHFVKFSV